MNIRVIFGSNFRRFWPKKKVGKILEFVGKNVNLTNFANSFWKIRNIFDITKMEKRKKNIGEHVSVSFYHVCLLVAFVGCAYSEGERNYGRFFIWSHISRNVPKAWVWTFELWVHFWGTSWNISYFELLYIASSKLSWGEKNACITRRATCIWPFYYNAFMFSCHGEKPSFMFPVSISRSHSVWERMLLWDLLFPRGSVLVLCSCWIVVCGVRLLWWRRWQWWRREVVRGMGSVVVVVVVEVLQVT